MYTFIHTVCRTAAMRDRFTAAVNFNSMLPQHVQDINILKVTSQWEEREMQEGGGGRLRCTSTVYEAESK